MNDDAIWAAAHPGYWLFGLPLVCGLLAAGGRTAWQACSAGPARRRIGAAVLLTMMLLFGVLAFAVMHPGRVVGFDQALARALDLGMDGAWLAPLAGFTFLGDRYFLFWLAIAMIGWQVWRRQWWLAAAAFLATAGGGALNWVLKQMFQRHRPPHAHSYVEATGYSFPSGHASASLLVYGFACYLVLCALPLRWRTPCVVMTAALVAGIGASRVLLQVHYLSDVLAGFAVSTLWLVFCVCFADWQSKSDEAERLSGL